MRKLEDIPRQAPFKVPDGYFDELPMKIQARMAKRGPGLPESRFFNFSLKFILPVVALLVAAFFWFRPAPPDSQLSDVDTEQIALYLNDVEHLDLEEGSETNGWTKDELDQLEDTIYSNIEYSNEDLLNDVDLDNL